MSLAEASEWTLQAKCRDLADALFPEGKDQKRARSVCMGCPVRSECLAEALDNQIEWGVWGGMTERERRALLRSRPDIESWHDVLVNYGDSSDATIRIFPSHRLS
ncbi:WhiB family transcriptional regulator [Tessaracoccus aquimaris]|uniref:Transcriptional regulator WhiB n=1 Tax=Tessaracoccus aquimaris TaxID=1332264 RepID=A0A1Q2CSK9_9ACTN|nr:WhiB family transcriptional regulator [Tessaracoccus aquimaris]AQP49055.1 WhiB family transcriptional regulator [Tessaracoccus aquimaris]